MHLSPKNHKWLDDFRARHGRAPRVLHIGNIANNAYNNAKLLNEAGLDCDVICYDYYHIMGCPEWEDAIFLGGYDDQFKPNWVSAGVHDFQRPRWFAQGPLRDCINYLIGRRTGLKRKAEFLWFKLGAINGTLLLENKASWAELFSWVIRLGQKMKRVIHFLLVSQGVSTRVARLCDEGFVSAYTRREYFRIAAAWILLTLVLITRITSLPVSYFVREVWRKRQNANSVTDPFDARVRELIAKFAEHFPLRSDSLSAADLEVYRSVFHDWYRLLQQYDLVHAYATDPIIPLLCGVPYVAFEHGTIRNIPFEATTQGRLCILSYRLSGWTVVTNADNMDSARRLGVERFSFVPHPVNENGIDGEAAGQQLRQQLLTKLDATFLVFHPSRQHWSLERHPDWEKGNDIFLRGFARFVHEANESAAAVLVDWGATVKESRQLIADLGIAKNVIWVPPMPHRKMVEYIVACDLVADQFFLGAFGSTLPKALACGRNAMLYLDRNMHKECFEELPPVLNTKTEDDVFRQLSWLWENKTKAYDMQQAGRKWYERYHSNTTITDKLIKIYAATLRDRDSFG